MTVEAGLLVLVAGIVDLTGPHFVVQNWTSTQLAAVMIFGVRRLWLLRQ